MNTIGVIAISVICGMFVLLLLGGLVGLIWLAWNIRKILIGFQKEMTGYQAEMKSIFESARTAFATIRNETRAQLEEHRRHLQSSIDKINAEELALAARRSIDACIRIEKAVSVFQKLILDNEDKGTNEYGPEEFAPENTTFSGPPTGFSVSPSARYDAESQQEDAERVTFQESQPS